MVGELPFFIDKEGGKELICDYLQAKVSEKTHKTYSHHISSSFQRQHRSL